MHILIIEDEEQLCRSVAEGLRIDGYETDICFDGDEGLCLCMTENYDLILLDLNLPGTDGLEILRQFREHNTNTPVLILSARDQIEDKVNGLDLGANDYLTKPFHFQELEARIRSLTRRKFVQEDVCLKWNQLTFDTRTRETSVNGVPISLTRKESSLLEYFLLHQNRVISPEEMIEHIWDGSVNTFSNSIRVHISSLRKKLKAAIGFDPIQNKIGQGYIWRNTDDKKTFPHLTSAETHFIAVLTDDCLLCSYVLLHQPFCRIGNGRIAELYDQGGPTGWRFTNYL